MRNDEGMTNDKGTHKYRQQSLDISELEILSGLVILVS